MIPEVTDERLKEYASWLIYDHAREVEFLTIHEEAERYFGSDTELTGEQARQVDEYISSASITVIVE